MKLVIKLFFSKFVRKEFKEEIFEVIKVNYVEKLFKVESKEKVIVKKDKLVKIEIKFLVVEKEVFSKEEVFLVKVEGVDK